MNIVGNFLRFISGGKFASPSIAVGQRWCLDSQTKNPYERNLYTVIVTDIKNGWVKWESVTSGVSGGTDTIEHFRWLHELLPEGEEGCLPCGHPQSAGVAIKGIKPHCSICYELIEEGDRAEYAKFHSEHIKPLQEAMEKLRNQIEGENANG